MEPAIATSVTRSKTTPAVPQGIITDCPIHINTNKSGLAVVVASNKTWDPRWVVA